MDLPGKQRWPNNDRKPFPGGEIVLADPGLAAEHFAAGQHAFQVSRDAAGALRLLDLRCSSILRPRAHRRG